MDDIFVHNTSQTLPISTFYKLVAEHSNSDKYFAQKFEPTFVNLVELHFGVFSYILCSLPTLMKAYMLTGLLKLREM